MHPCGQAPACRRFCRVNSSQQNDSSAALRRAANNKSEMNKYERPGRHSADIKTLPEDVAAELARMPTEVIDISDAPPIAPPAPLSPGEVRTILMSLLLTMFLAALDQTILATALPTIGRHFQDVSNLSSVLTAYLLLS